MHNETRPLHKWDRDGLYFTPVHIFKTPASYKRIICDDKKVPINLLLLWSNRGSADMRTKRTILKYNISREVNFEAHVGFWQRTLWW